MKPAVLPSQRNAATFRCQYRFYGSKSSAARKRQGPQTLFYSPETVVTSGCSLVFRIFTLLVEALYGAVAVHIHAENARIAHYWEVEEDAQDSMGTAGSVLSPLSFSPSSLVDEFYETSTISTASEIATIGLQGS